MGLVKSIKGIFYSIFLKTGIALSNVSEEFKTEQFEHDSDKKIVIKQRNNNPLLKKFEIGDRDEKYVKDYYEVLKKADKFMKHASSEQIEMAAEKNGMTYGKKDKWGRRFEHYGFYDPKSKHYGKTLGEVIDEQIVERKTNDDDFQVLFMINNTLPDEALSNILKRDIYETDEEFQIKKDGQRVKERKFKINVIRKKESKNRIEQLTSFLHIKEISSVHRQFEFFIEKKYGLHNYDEQSDIFKEIIDIDQIWFKDEWGETHMFSISNYLKRIDYDEKLEVIKFVGKIIEKL